MEKGVVLVDDAEDRGSDESYSDVLKPNGKITHRSPKFITKKKELKRKVKIEVVTDAGVVFSCFFSCLFVYI